MTRANHAQIVRQKLSQAISLLDQYDIDLWLTFVRETSLTKDPALDLIYPYDLTWQSAFMVSKQGESIAIVGSLDAENVERLAAFSQVTSYDESIRPAMIATLRRLQPEGIALNISSNDPAADGLTVGMRQLLDEVFEAAGVGQDRILSSEAFLGSLRGRKSPGEIALIRQAIATTEQLYAEVGKRIRAGVSELELANYLHRRLLELGLDTCWDWNFDPIVNTGPKAKIGHAAPGLQTVRPGHLVHFDFGLREAGFCSDLQRTWYVLEEGQYKPGEAVQRVWEGVRAALLAGAAALKPGAKGWEVDQAARRALVQDGLPEYRHAFGHHIGRVAHDGVTVLGPRWDRYGRTPYGEVEAGNVFAIELGAQVQERGWIYLEENVLVLEDSLEWLSTPQQELWLVPP